MQSIGLGILVGVLLSVADLILFGLCINRAKNEPSRASFWILVGMGLRYLLTLLVLGVTLLMPSINAVAVILILILQKILLTIRSLRK